MKIPHSFEMQVVPKKDGTFACALFLLPAQDSRVTKNGKPVQVSGINGWRMGLAQGAIYKILQAAKYKATELRITRRSPFKLTEEQGIRLDLVFRALNGLNSRSRIEDILSGIVGMSREEVYYWHAMVTRKDRTDSNNGIIALRVLLGGENR